MRKSRSAWLSRPGLQTTRLSSHCLPGIPAPANSERNSFHNQVISKGLHKQGQGILPHSKSSSGVWACHVVDICHTAQHGGQGTVPTVCAILGLHLDVVLHQQHYSILEVWATVGTLHSEVPLLIAAMAAALPAKRCTILFFQDGA